MSPLPFLTLLPLLTPATVLLPAPMSAGTVLGLSTPPLHFVIAADMTGSSKNPAYKYADQARLLSQSIMLNQVRSGDTLSLLRICEGVQTVADFKFMSKNGARMAKADILRYTGALTQPCTGRGSAITAGLSKANELTARTTNAGHVIVMFTDGALLDDPARAKLGTIFDRLLGRKDTRQLFFAGLSPEKDKNGNSIRDGFVNALGKAGNDARVLTAGAYDLNNVYPTFADAVKKARR